MAIVGPGGQERGKGDKNIKVEMHDQLTYEIPPREMKKRMKSHNQDNMPNVLKSVSVISKGVVSTKALP